MKDPALPPLDEDIRRLVARGAKLDLAPADARARVFERVQAAVAPPGSGAVTSGGEAAVGRAGAGVTSSLPTWRRVLPLLASFAVGSAVTAIVLRRPAPAPAAPLPRTVYVDRPTTPFVLTQPAPAREDPPTEPAPISPPPAALRPSVPSAPSGSGSHATSVPTSGAAANTPDRFAAERRLLDRARGALERGEPAAALDATTQHERDFPNGILVQEREAMAIRSLLLSKRSSEARDRAARFRARFPDSLLLPTIESTVAPDAGSK